MNGINKNQIDDKLFELYTLAELSYQNHFRNVNGELFPSQWYEEKNYKVKIEIISEAIKTNTLIVNTQSYQRIVEGVDTKIKNTVKKYKLTCNLGMKDDKIKLLNY